MKKYFVLFGIILLLISAGNFYPYKDNNIKQNQRDTNPPSMFYFAEGSTHPGYHTYFNVQNVGSSEAQVSINFYDDSGKRTGFHAKVPAKSHQTFNANTMLQEGTNFSTSISSCVPITANRQMYFNYKDMWSGGHTAPGLTTPDTTYYFAEGSTRQGWVTYFNVQNVGSSTATVDVTFTNDNGTTEKEKIMIPYSHSASLNASDIVGTGYGFSTVITSDQPLIAERPMYFNYNGTWSGGHISNGVTAPGTSWYFAEGSTRPGFQTSFAIQNPGTGGANVDITYHLNDGTSQQQSVMVDPRSRSTVDVNEFLGPGYDFGAVIESDKPIVAERPMYFNYDGKWPGGHTSTGISSPTDTWYFAEGTTRPGYSSYIAVMNPNDSSAQVDFTYYTGDPNPTKQTLTVSPESRSTVDVNNVLGDNYSYSARVISDTHIVVARSTYFDHTGGSQLNDGAVSWKGGYTEVGFTPDKWDLFLLNGSVKDSSNNAAIKKAKIRLIGKSKIVKGITKSTKSDKNGQFFLTKIRSGKYKIIARKAGYKVHRAKLKIKAPQYYSVKLEKK